MHLAQAWTGLVHSPLLGITPPNDRARARLIWPVVSIAVLGYLTVRSHVQHRRGALRWKGRALVR